MIVRSPVVSRPFLLAVTSLLGLLGSLVGAEAPAAKDTPVNKQLAAAAAPLLAALDLTDGRNNRLMRDLQALHAGADARLWPADVTTRVATAEGRKSIADLLAQHGFLPADLAWLEKLPQDPSDLHTSLVVLNARLLLQDGPARFDGLWPKWNAGDTPGTAPNEAQIERAELPALAATGTADILELLRTFIPKNPLYQHLQQHLAATEANQEKLRADFIPIPAIQEGTAIKPGAPYKDAPILAQRLSEEGYLAPPTPAAQPAPNPAEKPVYTAELAAAVKNFQEHHGRTADGIIGPNTLAELNRDPDDQLALLRINLHRSRLLPDDLGERFVMVNIPSAQVLLFAGGDKPAVMMKGIVGTEVKDRQTVIFRDIMERVEFGPYWNVPPSIATKEILPKARKNQGYLAGNNYEIVTSYEGGKAQPVNNRTLDQVAAGKLFLRQKPGPKNPLGNVKFLFPNDFSIYLHGTPDPKLFDAAERGFSHGCIRVEDPPALAEFVLGNQGWDRSRVEASLKTTEMQKVIIEKPLNVFIVYFTAFPNWDESDPRPVRFHPDIYARDEKLQ